MKVLVDMVQIDCFFFSVAFARSKIKALWVVAPAASKLAMKHNITMFLNFSYYVYTSNQRVLDQVPTTQYWWQSLSTD